MRPGPPRGDTATLEVTVTAGMAARVGSGTSHPVYGTPALAAHVEQVCRALLEPHLEPGEEGVGVALELQHRAPVPVGESVVLVATVAAVEPSRLVCEVLARHAGSIVARGTFEQRVVPRSALQAEIDVRRSSPQPT